MASVEGTRRFLQRAAGRQAEGWVKAEKGAMAPSLRAQHTARESNVPAHKKKGLLSVLNRVDIFTEHASICSGCGLCLTGRLFVLLRISHPAFTCLDVVCR